MYNIMLCGNETLLLSLRDTYVMETIAKITTSLAMYPLCRGVCGMCRTFQAMMEMSSTVNQSACCGPVGTTAVATLRVLFAHLTIKAPVTAPTTLNTPNMYPCTQSQKCRRNSNAV